MLNLNFLKSLYVIKIMTVAAVGLFIVACVKSNEPIEDNSVATYLTIEAIFQDYEYNAKRPGAIRWEKKGSQFTALETAHGFEDSILDKDQYGDDIKVYEEIVQYDPATSEHTILITLKQLIPKGETKALVVDDYQWSKDQNMLIIHTNPKYM